MPTKSRPLAHMGHVASADAPVTRARPAARCGGSGSAVRCLAAWFSAGHKDEETQAKLLARQFLVDALAGRR